MGSEGLCLKTSRLVLVLVLALALARCGGGGGNGGSSSSGRPGLGAPPPETSISQCITDAQDDVMIGAGAKTQCQHQVDITPSSNPGVLGVITINSGGTLVIGPQSGDDVVGIGRLLGRLWSKATSWIGVANAQTLTGSYPPR
jgi:hypothetical protein